VFGKMIELSDRLGDTISGRRVETVGKSTMPLDGALLYPGGGVTNEYVLGTLENKVFTGTAASNALALNRMAATPEPPPLRRSSDSSRSIDDRLRALGIGVGGR
jgi:hypothetical protein